MGPTIMQLHSGCRPTDPGEEIVISGISGRFPESRNMEELKNNLMNKKDLVTPDDKRWELDYAGTPNRHGKISDIDKFDSGFFEVPFKQADCMDPTGRMVLEHVYEAIVDAGVNPTTLRGTNTAVVLGLCHSESELTWIYDKGHQTNYAITGSSRAMVANRVSRWLGVRGPSYSIDTACSSSMYALDQAIRMIRRGECDAAIIGSGTLCLHPCMTIQFTRLGVLSQDGRCKCFDNRANGYVRSETMCVVFLQKAKDAKRNYATVLHTKTNCDGYKEQGITFPSSIIQQTLLEEFYKECDMSPNTVSYVEAHATGTKVGDPEELGAIDQVFCTGRKAPLIVGSIKSNLGHSEQSSGMCSIAKVIIAMETGLIPPNINFEQIRKGVDVLEQGRVRVVTEPTPWDVGCVGINSFGFGGANAHVLLRPNEKRKRNGGAPADNLPRLVIASGRTEQAVLSLFSSVENRPLDVEYIRLLEEAHAENIPGHDYRGYMIVGPEKSTSSVKKVQKYTTINTSLCFVFSGLGSQWPGMGAPLMKFKIFSDAIEKCNVALKPYRIDVVKIVTSTNKHIFDNIVNSVVGIAAIQIGLVDLLKAMNMLPNYIIGYSIGELGCSYADECITAEQMILAAYYMGLACTEIKMTRGAMAEVALEYKTVKNMCPKDIDIACHNARDNCTISGPEDSVKNFMKKLQANQTTVKEIPCSNVACHSRHTAAIRSKLLTYLKKVIPKPKSQSRKFLSTSIPRAEWSSSARTSSAEYHVNSFLGTVLFEETAALIPNRAVTIEIAPDGVLQSILRGSLRPDGINVALAQRDSKDSIQHFLRALGELYTASIEFHISNIYPPMEFPVSHGTPMIAPHIRWDHSESWFVTGYLRQDILLLEDSVINVGLSDEYYDYMGGHVIDGRVLLSATGYLVLVWEYYRKMLGVIHSGISVVFEDVKLERATSLSKQGVVKLVVTIQQGTGRFSITDGDTSVVTGKVCYTENPTAEMIPTEFLTEVDDEESLNGKDFYKELKLRGYDYSGAFRGVRSASVNGSKGHIEWINNWATFMDTMLQMYVLGLDTRNLLVPTSIEKLVINVTRHLKMVREMPLDNLVFPVLVDRRYDVIRAGGVEIRGVNTNTISRKKLAGIPVLEQYRFVAYRSKEDISLEEMVTLTAHLTIENHMVVSVKIMEIVHDEDVVPEEKLFSPLFIRSFDNLPLIQTSASLIAMPGRFSDESLPANVTIIEEKKMPADKSITIAAGCNFLSKGKANTMKKVFLAMKNQGYILTRENVMDDERVSRLHELKLDIILEKKFGNETLLLLKKREDLPERIEVVHVDSNRFGWLERLQSILKEEVAKESSTNMRLILVAEGDPESGLLGLANCLRKEPGGELVRTFVIQDENAPKFSLKTPFYAKQLGLNMAVNVLRSECAWGSYRHLPLQPPQPRPVFHAYVSQEARADLSSLGWVQGSITPDTRKEDIVYITHSALNFKDVMLATGKLNVTPIGPERKSADAIIGFEYSGVTADGRRVMGIIEKRGLANVCLADKYLTWEIPDSFTLEDAATIPCTYGTCYYALYVSGKMRKGDKVLIHAGTGGVGQSAINLALHEGCEVFTTVGTPDKRRFIKELFPSIDDDHIGNSRDTSFEQMILERTNGRGVDIVLNSLAEEKLQASIRCLAPGGRFLEIGKFDLASNNNIGMRPFLKGISFHGIMLDALINGSDDLKMELRSYILAGLKNNAIKPLNRICFPRNEVEAAFRYMAAAKHTGKVLIKIHDDNEDITAPILAVPQYYCLPNRSYVIFGGLGGLGLEVADWLVLRGAEILILISRSGIKNGYQQYRINAWKSYGVKVSVISGVDASTDDGCEYILKSAEKEAPVDGIFNLAALLFDNACVNQTVKDFEDSVRPKSWITKKLDKFSRKLCPKLRHFVIFSSVSCGRGTPGQTNYGLGNSVMERICERRAAEGLPALAIQWGTVGEVGLVADMQDNNHELIIGGTLQQKVSSCLHELNKFLIQDRPIVGSMVVAEKQAGSGNVTTVYDAVLDIMGLHDLKGVSTQISLAELGMDSMMAVEVKQTLERDFEVFLTPQAVRNLTFAKLIQMSETTLEEEAETSNNSAVAASEVLGMNLLLRTLGTVLPGPEICVELSAKTSENQNEMFFVPGIEGNAAIFSPLAPHLKRPVTCLQLGSKETDKLDDLVQFFLPHILERSTNGKNFALVGYSFGSLLAIELTRALEAQNFTGELILIDASPDFVEIMLANLVPSNTLDGIATDLILFLMNFFFPSMSRNIIPELNKRKGWDEKLDLFLERMPSEALKLPDCEVRSQYTGIYKRLLCMKNYDASKLPPLRTPITLLKPTDSSVRNIEEDYGLSKITTGKVKVHEIGGNHLTVLDNKTLVDIINGHVVKDT